MEQIPPEMPHFLPFSELPQPRNQLVEAGRYVVDLSRYLQRDLDSFELQLILTGEVNPGFLKTRRQIGIQRAVMWAYARHLQDETASRS